MKKIISIFIIFVSLFTISYTHSGRTDSNGGHYNRSTGEYHYHHGYSAHQHPNGICPYETVLSQEDETVIIGTEEEGQEIIDDYEKQIEELQEEIRNKEENIEELNREIEEKDNKIEQLEDDKQALHCIYWFVIICMGIFIWNSIKND